MTVPPLFDEFLPSLFSGHNGVVRCHCGEGEERCNRSIQAEALEKGRTMLLNVIALYLPDNGLVSLVQSLYCGQNHESESSLNSHLKSWRDEKKAFVNKLPKFSAGPVNNHRADVDDSNQTHVPSEGQSYAGLQFNTPLNCQLATPSSSGSSKRVQKQNKHPQESREESPSNHSPVVVAICLPNPFIEGQEQESATDSTNTTQPSQGREELPDTPQSHTSAGGNADSHQQTNNGPVQQKIQQALDQFTPGKRETVTNDNKIRGLARQPATEPPSKPSRGYLYAMRDLGHPQYAVKVGSSNDISKRKDEMESECGYVKFKIVSRREEEELCFVRRAEYLAHKLLSGHRPTADWPGVERKGKKEYFVVSDAQAQQAIDIASRFTRVAYRSDGNIIPFWKRELNVMAKGPAQEDLTGRLARWSSWLTRTERRCTLCRMAFWFYEVLALVTVLIACMKQLVSHLLQDRQADLSEVIRFGLQGFALGVIVICGSLGEDLLPVS